MRGGFGEALTSRSRSRLLRPAAAAALLLVLLAAAAADAQPLAQEEELAADSEVGRALEDFSTSLF